MSLFYSNPRMVIHRNFCIYMIMDYVQSLYILYLYLIYNAILLHAWVYWTLNLVMRLGDEWIALDIFVLEFIFGWKWKWIFVFWMNSYFSVILGWRMMCDDSISVFYYIIEFGKSKWVLNIFIAIHFIIESFTFYGFINRV